MMSEIQRIEWRKLMSELVQSAKEATKAVAIFSLVASGISADSEDIDILNAKIIDNE